MSTFRDCQSERFRHSESWTAFHDFVSQHAFLHDDFQRELLEADGSYDWDQFGANAFLVGAKVCVADNLAAFGEPYLEYLRELDSYAAEVVRPHGDSPSILENLLQDEIALNRFVDIVVGRRLDVSPFYADESKRFDILLALLAARGHPAKLHPDQNVFIQANNKVNARSIFERAGVAIPDGRVCRSSAELDLFCRTSISSGGSVVVKQGHWQSLHVVSVDEIGGLQAIRLPVVAELVYPVLASPVVQMLRWNGRVYRLGIMAQHIVGFRHRGNGLPTDLPIQTEATLWSLADRIAAEMEDFTGVFGIDFIVLADGQILAVDLNPRFNSSTYPLAFLVRCGIDLARTFARIRWLHCQLNDLSQLLQHTGWLPFARTSGEGVLAFGPVMDNTRTRIKRFMYLVVSSTHDRMDLHERDFLHAVADVQSHAGSV